MVEYIFQRTMIQEEKKKIHWYFPIQIIKSNKQDNQNRDENEANTNANKNFNAVSRRLVHFNHLTWNLMNMIRTRIPIKK